MLALSCLKILLAKIFFVETYGSELEHYISSRNPQNTGDVERLQKEYSERVIRGY